MNNFKLKKIFVAIRDATQGKLDEGYVDIKNELLTNPLLYPYTNLLLGMPPATRRYTFNHNQTKRLKRLAEECGASSAEAINSALTIFDWLSTQGSEKGPSKLVSIDPATGEIASSRYLEVDGDGNIDLSNLLIPKP